MIPNLFQASAVLSAALAALLMVSAPVQAADDAPLTTNTNGMLTTNTNGIDYYRICTANDEDIVVACGAYTIGVVDAFATVNNLHDTLIVNLCPSQEAEVFAAIDVVLAAIEKSRSALGPLPAPLVIALALGQDPAYRCDGQ